MYYDDPIGPPVACFWEAKLERWPKLQDKPGNYPVSRGFCYLGPCLTHDEASALQKRIAKLEAALRFATEYVGRLASTLAKKHYPDQQHFELLPDLLGRIDQIDNMTCGLHRAALEGGEDGCN